MNPPDPLPFEVLNEVGIIDQLASTAFTRVLPRPMTIAQFSVLNHFLRLGHAWRTPAQLASAFQVSRPTMSNTLARLERAGLVEIAPDPDDGRGKRVSITDQGRAMRDECLGRLSGPMAELETLVPRALFEALLPGLRELRKIMDAMRD